jgi:hypothetical protein
MHIANMAKFIIGIVFLIVAVGLLFYARGERGFGQMRQIAALSFVAAGLFLAVGMGWLNLWGH